MHKRRQGSQWNRIRPIVLAVAALGAGGNAAAFNIDTGNEDLEVRWDNTIRYNVAGRTKGRNPLIAGNQAYDQGTFSKDRGDAVANRIDLLTEFDLSYKKMLGFRFSGAGWYDGAYGDDPHPNPKFAAIGEYNGNHYSSYTKRYYQGPAGEVLDAFVFANFDLGNVPTKVRGGRHTVFWGEALFLGGALHGISYSQMPLDLQKGFATPGVEAKELFRPLNQVSGQVQVTDTLSLAGQYFLEWEPYRYPEGGTYLGPADFAFNGPDRVFAGAPLGFVPRGDAREPKQRGEFGLSARWSPEFLDGTLGFYYRNYADKLPQALLNLRTARNGVPFHQYNLTYADDIDLYGISFAKNIGGVSVGAEMSYRHNTPLAAKILGTVTTGFPGEGETVGPRGDTLHALVNVLGTISETPLFGAATWATELVWSRLEKVRSGANNFSGVGYGGCSFAFKPVGDVHDGCATRDYFGLGASFTPTWFQVSPGVDLSAPMAFSYGLKGNSATTFGGSQANGNFTAGLGLDIFQKYRIDLKYVSYFGRIQDYGQSGGSTNITAAGLTTYLKDRDFLGLTFKTTF
ncbi:hypothetical protein AT959_01355 [Dechloromonas denitrificans]|uniref:DUF1302 domain-containing protein n=1 Tax=Dechloromonas denitrificans TaxID=281362 RepID=A0A133XN56_9RHOO|nr:DUF1302 domain-containing protein [Dechloromonas denitrificans]KXB32370.1 hypothetical protein AT959_01355 [Dechloromonas denitrificans]